MPNRVRMNALVAQGVNGRGCFRDIFAEKIADSKARQLATPLVAKQRGLAILRIRQCPRRFAQKRSSVGPDRTGSYFATLSQQPYLVRRYRPAIDSAYVCALLASCPGA